MKASKWFTLSGLVLTSSIFLVACGNSSSQQKEVSRYSYAYAIDPDTLDYVATNRSATNDISANIIDGLLENDQYGNLVPSMAESWTVSKDGLTYTYKLRKDAKWYTSDGEEYATVKAQDFVTGLKHAADVKSDALDIVQDSVKGLNDYVTGVTNDFSTVGVKALDDHTVQYTLNQPESFWNSKTTIGVLFPINEDFLTSQGKDFGTVKPSSILYNGPYILKNLTSKSVIEYAKNQNYWDKDKVKIDEIKLSYVDGSDPEGLVRNFEDGAYTNARLYPTSSNYSGIYEKYKDSITYRPQDGTTYYYAFNIHRQKYDHTAKTSDGQKNSTREAILNKNFRQSINFAVNRTAWAAQANGEDGANKVLRTNLVPSDFVQVGDKTFGQVSQGYLLQYGQQWQGVQFDDAQDSIYNVDKAKAAFAKAKEELADKGVEYPIHLDLPVEQTDKLAVAQANSLKQSIESALGSENVVIDVNQMSDDDKASITYQAPSPADKDYDMNMSGWGPDFQDPATYLDIFDPDHGAVMKHLGIEKGKDKDIITKVSLDAYQKLLDDANDEKLDVKARYEKYAQAQAWLQDSSLAINMSSYGGFPEVRRTVPYSRVYGIVGIKGESLKGLEVQKDIVSVKDFEKASKKWREEKAKSNAKAQADLENHIKD